MGHERTLRQRGHNGLLDPIGGSTSPGVDSRLSFFRVDPMFCDLGSCVGTFLLPLPPFRVSSQTGSVIGKTVVPRIPHGSLLLFGTIRGAWASI